MTIYLTGVTTADTRAAGRSDLGLLVSPDNATHHQIRHYDNWAADNGQYSASKAGRTFDPDRWLAWLDGLPRTALFVTLPDVLDWVEGDDGELVPVGNLDATLELSGRYVDAVIALGFTPALVAQDGLRDLSQVPFLNKLGALFIGGSDAYKLGRDAATVLGQARERGLWTHIGRVNSLGRLAYCDDIGADSADGTYIGRGIKVNFRKVIGWLNRLAKHVETYKLADGYRRRIERMGIEPGYFDDWEHAAA